MIDATHEKISKMLVHIQPVYENYKLNCLFKITIIIAMLCYKLNVSLIIAYCVAKCQVVLSLLNKIIN